MDAHCESKAAVLVALRDASVLDVTQTLEAAEQEPTAEGFVARRLRCAIALLDAHGEAWHLSYALRFRRRDPIDEGIRAAAARYAPWRRPRRPR